MTGLVEVENDSEMYKSYVVFGKRSSYKVVFSKLNDIKNRWYWSVFSRGMSNEQTQFFPEYVRDFIKSKLEQLTSKEDDDNREKSNQP